MSAAWTALVAASAALIGVLWLLLSIERMGAQVVFGFIGMALLVRFTRR